MKTKAVGSTSVLAVLGPCLTESLSIQGERKTMKTPDIVEKTMDYDLCLHGSKNGLYKNGYKQVEHV